MLKKVVYVCLEFTVDSPLTDTSTQTKYKATNDSMSKVFLKVLLAQINFCKKYCHNVWQLETKTRIFGPVQTITQKSPL